MPSNLFFTNEHIPLLRSEHKPISIVVLWLHIGLSKDATQLDVSLCAVTEMFTGCWVYSICHEEFVLLHFVMLENELSNCCFLSLTVKMRDGTGVKRSVWTRPRAAGS